MFTYKGKTSKEMGLRVLNDLEFVSPVRDVDLIQVPGRDGDLIMDNGRFNSVVRSVPCILEVENSDIETRINEINNWLATDVNFHDFEWKDNSEFKYLAKVEDSVVSSRLLSRLGNTTIDFRLHPIKYLKSSLVPRVVASGEMVVNPFTIPAKPILEIRGVGDITVSINQQELVLRGIGNGGCIVDTESQTITDLTGTRTLFEFMYSGFPVLAPGNNVITFGTNVESILVTPRLGALV